MDERQRKWFCRITKKNNTKNGIFEYNFDDLYAKLISKYDNVLFALHDKDKENIHCHVIIQNENAITFSALKKLIPYGNIEKQRGSNIECFEYCLHIDEKSKKTEKDIYDESCIKTNIQNLEAWKKVENNLGVRNDLTSLVEDLKQGATKYEILEKYPSQFLRYSKSIIFTIQELLQKENAKTFRQLEVTYIYGSTGVGKTRYVMEKFGYENVFRVSAYGRSTFDGYNGQDVMLFDEFRSSIPIAQMLMYLDGYPIALPCRYQDKPALFTKVYIVSNIPLEQQYAETQEHEKKTYDAFCRRITTIYNFDISKDAPLVSSNLTLIPNIKIDDIFK